MKTKIKTSKRLTQEERKQLATIRKTETRKAGKWLWKPTRITIYQRDGFKCLYCGATQADGAILTADHIHPWKQGGENHWSNLVTACLSCNSARGEKSVTQFCNYLKDLGVTEKRTRAIKRKVVRVVKMDDATFKIYKKQAKDSGLI